MGVDGEFYFMTVIAGVVATHCTLAMALWAYRLGLPRADFPAGMADLTYGPAFAEAKPPYWSGLFVINLNGLFFAFMYATVFGPLLPGPPMLRGAIYGGLLFFASGLFFQPLFLRLGWFLAKAHPKAWITSAMVHGIFGLVCGWLAPIAEKVGG